MHKMLAALLPAVLLGGCAFTELEQGLGGLVGQDVGTAVVRLGAPNTERRVGGLRELEWTTFANRPVVLRTLGSNGLQLPQSVYVAPVGTPGLLPMRIPAEASWSASRLGTRPQYCKVIVQVDSRDVIRQTRYDGDFEGCYAYGQRLGKPA